MRLRSRVQATPSPWWIALLLMLCNASSFAASAVVIWPVDPTLTGSEKATALWLENKGKEPVVLQTRVFSWSQAEGEDAYHPQTTLMASPPMAQVAPGARQLIRLMRTAPDQPSEESAYRVLIDEIPTDLASRPAGQDSLGVTFRMRYSVPLFTYRAEHAAKAEEPPPLRWRITTQHGQRVLEITNQGTRHARLTDVRFTDAAQPVSEGLLGYVLPGSTMRWPLPDNAAGTQLRAGINGHEVPPLPKR